VIVETKQIYKKCDICNSVITERNGFLNSGEYTIDSVKVGTLDICAPCCVKLFQRMVEKEDVYEQYINDLVLDMRDVRHIFTTRVVGV